MPLEDPRRRLRRAACEGNLQLVKRLSTKTNLQNHDSENGWTTLMYATRYGHTATVEYLLQNGHEDYEISRDFENNTTLIIAAQYDYLEIVKLFVSVFPDSVDMANKKGQTALILACKEGHIEIIKFLLGNGANINQTDHDGNTALHYAAAWDRFQVVKFLIESGIHYNVKNAAGWTALDYSFSRELETFLQECVHKYFEEAKITRKRNLRVTVDSVYGIENFPITTRSATFPRPSNEAADNGIKSAGSMDSLSPDDSNLVKRKESLPW
ncbi:962_t:CDS:2 [Paraglomus occultum]|uniref:962_t:CDS:1 n=1 Tax=Paraglomus occultum TaxID=144539 RepID=A0A9N9APZ5_9GLOM|nr:962_t:CDS:2 [Paraglomus occultum]